MCLLDVISKRLIFSLNVQVRRKNHFVLFILYIFNANSKRSISRLMCHDIFHQF